MSTNSSFWLNSIFGNVIITTKNGCRKRQVDITHETHSISLSAESLWLSKASFFITLVTINSFRWFPPRLSHIFYTKTYHVTPFFIWWNYWIERLISLYGKLTWEFHSLGNINWALRAVTWLSKMQKIL